MDSNKCLFEWPYLSNLILVICQYVGPDMKMYVFDIKVNIFLKEWNQKAMALQNKIQTTVWIAQD